MSSQDPIIVDKQPGMQRTTSGGINRTTSAIRRQTFNEEGGFLEIVKASAFEAVAYFLLVFVIFANNGDSTKFIFGIFAIFMIFGNVSGAHINPIVTLGLWLHHGRLNECRHMIKLISYFIAQFVGGLLAVILCLWLYKQGPTINPGVQAAMNNQWIAVAFVEGLLGGSLVFIVLFISNPYTRPSDKNYVNLTLLSVWFFLIINAGSSVSGSSFNPTIYLLLNGVSSYLRYKTTTFYYLPVMLISPFVGSIIFTILFKYVFKPYYIQKNMDVITEIEEGELNKIEDY